jgi:hypothetical protein
MLKQNKSKTVGPSSTSPTYFYGRLLKEEDFEKDQQYLLPHCCIVRGIVTKNVDPAGCSRVEINVPTVATQPLWASVVQSSAKARSIPKIGTQVAVAFEEGDIRRPLVLGTILGT